MELQWRSEESVEAIIRDEKSVLPVSSIQHDTYGIEGVTLSMPAIVGKNGNRETAGDQAE